MSAYGQILQTASKDVGELSKLTSDLTLQQTINALSKKNLTKDIMVEILANKGLVTAEAEAVATKIASTQANGVATFSLSAYTTALWANIKALGVWMLTNPVGWIIGIVSAVGIAVTAYNHFNETIEEQKEKISELKEEYKNTVQELESITDEIISNTERINELFDKQDNNTITLVEEDELKKLSAANKLLKEKQLIEKDEKKDQASELAKKNKKAFSEEFGDTPDTELQNDLMGNYSLYGARIVSGEDLSDKDLILSIKALYTGINDAAIEGNETAVQTLTEGQESLIDILNGRKSSILAELVSYQDTLSLLMNPDGTFNNPEDQQSWDLIESWKKEIYKITDSSGEWNTIQIEAAMDDSSLQEVQAKLKNQVDNGTLTEIDITHYTGLHEALEKANLILEKGQSPASVYLKYLRSIAVSQQDVNSTVPEFSFNGDNATLIDNYQSQINDLNAAFGQISDGSMTPSGLLDLLQSFPELTTRTDDLSSAIQELIENKLKVLKDELRDQGASEEILALFDNVTESTRNINLGNVLSGLSEIHSSIENVKKEYEDTKKISVETLQEITSKYPNLTNAVHLYLQGKINEQQLMNELQTQYQTDLSNYESYIIEKRKIDDDFYDDIVSNLSDDLIDKAKSYGIDLGDYANYTAAKLSLDAEYAKMRDEVLEVEEPPKTFTQYSALDGLVPGVPQIDESKLQENLQKEKEKELKNFDKFIKEFNTAAQEIINNFDPVLNFTPTGGGDTGGGDGGTQDNSEAEIDWLDQSLSNLQREADRLETVFDNTKGIKNQITALGNLNDALGDLKKGYQDAADEYDDRYTDALSKLPNQEEIKSMIESGEEFDISKYTGEDTKTAEIIQDAIDAYNSKKDADEKVAELTQTIDDNKGLEKYKLYQQYYEGYLDVINEQLNDQTLTADEKNALLDKQYYVQKKINDTLRKQAEYENDLLTISKLNQEDENNEKQKYLDKLQNNKDQNQVYIDTYDTLLEDDSLTKSETKSLLKSKKGATDKDYRYKFKEIIATIGDDTWNNYIQNLKEQYGQTKMDDNKFIKKHIDEIASYFDYTGMLKLLSEYYTSNEDYDQSLYDTDENNRIYKINKRNNKITDIQHDIDLKNGNGTEEEYVEMRGLHEKNKKTWKNQLADAKDVLENTDKNTKEWDEANAKVQELENNIYDCDKGIQECNVSILQLSLKGIEDSLENVNDKLDDINEQITDYDTYISAANIVLDEQIEFQESQKKIVQDQIDALQKEHDLRESNLNVQKAEWNLQKIKNNKSVKVFKEGQGFIFESDADEVNNAQHELDEAIYNNKISLLQNQIDTYDEEIDRLNDIKESFNNIKTDIEDIIVLSKALVYDADFINKVLSGDINLINAFKDGYQELLTNKDLYENEQKVLSDAQAEIEDIIEDYKDGSISIDQAQALIDNVVSESTLSIDAYKQEMKAIQDTAQKELDELETTKKTSEDKVNTTNESNEAILQSYNSLYDNLSVVFGNLNTIMEDFVTKTQAMASSVSKSLASIKVAMNVMSGIDNSLSSTIPTVSDNVSSNYKKVSDDIAKKYANIGSALIGTSLATGIKVGAIKTPAVTSNNSSKTNLSFNGDIIVNSTGDVNALSKDIVAQLPGAMLQTIFKNK